MATGSSPVVLRRLTDKAGAPVCPKSVASTGEVLPALEAAQADLFRLKFIASVARVERHWRERLRRLDAAELPQAKTSVAASAYVRRTVELPDGLTGDPPFGRDRRLDRARQRQGALRYRVSRRQHRYRGERVSGLCRGLGTGPI